MKPVFWEDFLPLIYKQNTWMDEYFPFFLKDTNSSSGKKGSYIDNSYCWYFIFGDIFDQIAQFAQLFYMKIMGHSCQKGEILKRNEVRLFGNKEWEKRKKDLDRKLQLYDL